ncbi:MAG TPA: hypothetical protein VGB31_03565 [Myxococcota bacterium]
MADDIAAFVFEAADDAFVLVVENFVVTVELEDLFVVSLGADVPNRAAFDQFVRVVGDTGSYRFGASRGE